jgi:hypothetical protein
MLTGGGGEGSGGGVRGRVHQREAEEGVRCVVRAHRHVGGKRGRVG